MCPRTILRALPPVNPARLAAVEPRFYLPLLLSFGAGDIAPELGVLDDELLVSGGVDDDAPALLGGVVALEELELDGGVFVEGGVDDDEVDGDGVTTGGVVPLLVDDSRLQPAMPSARPVQSSVIHRLFILCLRE